MSTSPPPSGSGAPGPQAVLVAVGANLGTPAAAVEAAIERLRTLAAGGFKASSRYRSAPVDCPPGSPMFVNAAVVFEVGEGSTPEQLLRALQALEAEFGRAAVRERNSPRPIDLDLILFGAQQRSDDWLTLPHPRAHLRRFVLEPAAEIAPDWRWPGVGERIDALLQARRVAEARGEVPAETLARIAD